MKQKIPKLSIALGIVAIFIIVVSTIQWLFLYPDMSQFALAVSIGIVVLGFAYIYKTIKEIDENMEEFNTGMDAMNICFRAEIDKLKEKVNKLKEKVDKLKEKVEDGTNKDN